MEKITTMMKSLFPIKYDSNDFIVIIHVDNWQINDESNDNNEIHSYSGNNSNVISNDKHDIIKEMFIKPNEFENHLRDTFSDNIIVIHSNQKIGVSESRNKLINFVKDSIPTISYIKLSDDDDESVPILNYIHIIEKYDPDFSKVCVIEGTSTLKRVNKCFDESIIQTCIKNDYLLTKDLKILDSIGKFSKGVIWSLIIHKSILYKIPFLTLTSFEDSFFRYMLYEYCRINKIQYIYTDNLMYIYHGASGNANNYVRKITASDLDIYDKLYMEWTMGEKINYIQLLKFVFPFIHVIPYFNKENNKIERCTTIKNLSESIVDFRSFGSKILPNTNNILFNNRLDKLLRNPDKITDTDIYYSVITQYNIIFKELRYINYSPDENIYEKKTLENIMKKYPPENNEKVINCYNTFNSLTNLPVRSSILLMSGIDNDFNFFNKYSINGLETDQIISNFILFSLIKKHINNTIQVRKPIGKSLI